MQYSEKALEAQKWFAERGIEAFPSRDCQKYVGLNDGQKEEIKLHDKIENDAMREHWETINKCDITLVLNYDKHGIPGYIGGNAFLEMGFAYILYKPIYLLNPIPEMPYYKTEIIAMKPSILNGDLEKLIDAS
jgi:nucleoside 2-deoxyribosyltransferase